MSLSGKWHWMGNQWHYYNASGIQPLKLNEPVAHVSYYEASAFAAWKGMRLPTEFEWEAACHQFEWGNRWERPSCRRAIFQRIAQK